MKQLTKTIIAGASLLFSFAHQTLAQEVKDQFTIMREFGRDAEMMTINLDNGENGEVTPHLGYRTYKLKFSNNKFDKLNDFFGLYVSESNSEDYIGSNLTPNHYTKPSFFFVENAKEPGIPKDETRVYVFVGDYLYKLEGKYEDIKSGGAYKIENDRFGRRYDYTIYYMGGSGKKEANKEKDGKSKKKLGARFKDVMAEALDPEAAALAKIPKESYTMDHRKAIDDYLAAMEKVQAKITLTAEEKKEKAEIHNDKLAKVAGILKMEEDHRKMMMGGKSRPKVTIKNSGNSIISIYCGKSLKRIHGRSEVKCNCDEEVTRSNNGKMGGPVISSKDSNCGKTITIQ